MRARVSITLDVDQLAEDPRAILRLPDGVNRSLASYTTDDGVMLFASSPAAISAWLRSLADDVDAQAAAEALTLAEAAS